MERIRSSIVLAAGTVVALSLGVLAFTGSNAGATDAAVAPVIAPTDVAPTTAPADLPAPSDDRDPNRRHRGSQPGGPPPGMAPGQGPGPGPGYGGMGGRRWGRYPGAGLPDVSRELPNDDEWNAIADFWKEHAPERFREFGRFENDLKALNIDVAQQQTYRLIRMGMAIRYRLFNAMQSDQSNLAGFIVEQMKDEDVAFGLFRDLTAKSQDPSKSEAYRKAVEECVDTSLRERQSRLDALKKSLEKEQLNLDEDIAKKDELIKKQTSRFEKQFKAILSRPTTQPAK
ncbi:MAG: hypothetical protein QM770_11195 [Tepidisphaeraceae bacterium]